MDAMELREKLEELRGALGALDSLMVAYSGGTDSAFLAYEAHRALGERMLAVSWSRRSTTSAPRESSPSGPVRSKVRTRELRKSFT